MKIIHVDMDQFFAAVEQQDNPKLKGKPIAVGHDAERGVVSTASYEARRFGVHSAQSIQLAKRLCPELIIVEPHFQRYKEVSAHLHEIFHEYTDLIEPISLDEAFLDVTENKKGIELAVDIAKEIKQRYQVWIARYGEYKPDVHLVFWQLSPEGRVAGIHGPVDINVFNGYGLQYQEFLRNNTMK